MSSYYRLLKLIGLLPFIVMFGGNANAGNANAVGFQTGKYFNLGGSSIINGNLYPGYNASLVAADFNGDGRLDFAVATPLHDFMEEALISIMTTNQDGTVSSTQLLHTGVRYFYGGDPVFGIRRYAAPILAVGDFNGDGKPDIAFSIQGNPFGNSIVVFMNDGTGHFSGPVVVATGIVVDNLATGDFNSDGRSEIAFLERPPIVDDSQYPVSCDPICSSDHNSIAIFGMSSPDTWAQLQNIDVPGYGALVAGDFDGDGTIDLLVGNEPLLFQEYRSPRVPDGDLLLIPGSKGGGFGKPIVVARGVGYISQIGVADFNHDGRLDLVLSAFTEGPCDPAYPPPYYCHYGVDHKLLVLMAVGKNSSPSSNSTLFREVARYQRPSANAETPILVSDLNGDGEIDIVDEGDILLGTGDGHFKRVASYVPAILAVSDVDGDGRPDLITAFADSLVVYPGNGNGTFQGPVGLPSDGTNPASGFGYIAATTGDFNGDGKPDLAMYQDGAPTQVLVYLNRGTGVFGGPTSIINGSFPNAAPDQQITADLLTGDFNNDGTIDIVSVGGGSNIVSSYLGNGDGTFRPGPQSQIGQVLGAATVQDFNRDGKLDVATIEKGNFLEGALYLLAGNGDGSFTSSSTVTVPNSLYTLDVGDFIHADADDRHTVGNDIVSASQNGALNIVSQLSKPVPFVTQIPSGLSQVSVLATADFNHDGYADFVVAGSQPDGFNISVYLGDGDGNFSQHEICSVAGPVVCGPTTGIVVADFDGDGNLDLFTNAPDFAILPCNEPGVCDVTYEDRLFLGNGDGTFRQTPRLNVIPNGPNFPSGSARTLHVADINGDGAPDVISTLGFILYNTGGTFITASSSKNSLIYRKPVTITALVKPGLPGTGNPTGTIDFYDDSALPSQKIGTAVLAGDVASITTSDLSIGTHMIRPRYLGDANFNPHDGTAVAVTVTSTDDNQRGGQGGSSGQRNESGNCKSEGKKHEPMQSVRSIDLSPSGQVGLFQTPQGGDKLGQRGDQKLDKPQITGSPVAPEGDLAFGHLDGLPITGPVPGLFGFDGLTNLDSLGAGEDKQRSVEPSDQALAANKTHIMQVVNSAMAIYGKDGKLLAGPIAVNAVFGLPPVLDSKTNSFGPFVTDPRAMWDDDTNRWFITALEIDTNPSDGNFRNHARVLLAVSQTSDPTGSFYQYSIDITDAGFGKCPCLGDQPLMGANQDALFITTDQFAFSDSSFQTALVLAVDKYDLIRGTALKSVALQSLQAEEEPGFAIQPARITPGADSPNAHGGTEFFVSSLGFSKVRDNRLAVWSVTNTSSLRTDRPSLQIQQTLLSTESYSTPGAVPQKDGPRSLSPLEPLELLDTSDDRAQQVFYSDGNLYTSLTTGLPAHPTQTGVAWFVIHPSGDICPFGASIVQQGYVVAADGSSLMFPAIGVDRHGRGVIAFSMSGVTLFPSLGYVEFDRNKIGSGIHVAAAGTGPEDGFSGYRSLGGNGEARWGDYSAVAVSPDGEVWFAGAYIPSKPRATEANWGTFVARMPEK